MVGIRDAFAWCMGWDTWNDPKSNDNSCMLYSQLLAWLNEIGVEVTAVWKRIAQFSSSSRKSKTRKNLWLLIWYYISMYLYLTITWHSKCICTALAFFLLNVLKIKIQSSEKMARCTHAWHTKLYFHRATELFGIFYNTTYSIILSSKSYLTLTTDHPLLCS
jgi:hypothetical protein